MSVHIINTIGLSLDILGSVLLFFFGPPQPSFEEGVGLGLEDANILENGKTVKQHNADIRKLRYKYVSISRFAIFLIIIGFAFQLWANCG